MWRHFLQRCDQTQLEKRRHLLLLLMSQLTEEDENKCAFADFLDIPLATNLDEIIPAD